MSKSNTLKTVSEMPHLETNSLLFLYFITLYEALVLPTSPTNFFLKNLSYYSLAKTWINKKDRSSLLWTIPRLGCLLCPARAVPCHQEASCALPWSCDQLVSKYLLSSFPALLFFFPHFHDLAIAPPREALAGKLYLRRFSRESTNSGPLTH